MLKLWRKSTWNCREAYIETFALAISTWKGELVPYVMLFF